MVSNFPRERYSSRGSHSSGSRAIFFPKMKKMQKKKKRF
jgi:hypothetical protein